MADPQGKPVAGGHRRAPEGAHPKHPSLLVHEEHLGVRAPRDLDSLGDDPVQDPLQIQPDMTDRVARSSASICSPLHRGGMQSGVLDGDGGLGGEEPDEVLILLREWSAGPGRQC
jgi:hypothetical protein